LTQSVLKGDEAELSRKPRCPYVDIEVRRLYRGGKVKPVAAETRQGEARMDERLDVKRRENESEEWDEVEDDFDDDEEDDDFDDDEEDDDFDDDEEDDDFDDDFGDDDLDEDGEDDDEDDELKFDGAAPF
jgi:hypothetical protein